MSGQRKRLYLHEVATRDGLQNEAAFVDTDDKIALVDALSACGYAKIEVTSFTSPKAIPALRDAEAVMHGIARTGRRLYGARAERARGGARAVVRGRRSEPRDVDERKPQPREPADDARAVVRTTARRDRCGTRHRCRDQRVAVDRDGLPDGRRCCSRRRTRMDAALRGSRRARLHAVRYDGHGVSVAGARPVGTARERFAALQLTLHFHNTRGMALANTLAALDAGIDRFDASLGGPAAARTRRARPATRAPKNSCICSN